MQTVYNEILQEVWRNRDEFAKEYRYNLDAMVAALQQMEKYPLTHTIDRRKQTEVKPSGSKERRSGGDR